jgi:hypothetical protein
MPGAIVVIGRTQIRTCHETVAGFLRQAGDAIRRVSVRLSDTASGVTVEEKTWFNDSTDAAVLAVEVAEHIVRIATVRSDLEAIISVSDEDSAIRSGGSLLNGSA